MLLIQLCPRWLTWQMPATPAVSGIDVESHAARATTAQPAVQNTASQHRIGLAPIHAPPPLLLLS